MVPFMMVTGRKGSEMASEPSVSRRKGEDTRNNTQAVGRMTRDMLVPLLDLRCSQSFGGICNDQCSISFK